MSEKVIISKKNSFKVSGIEYDYFSTDVIKKYSSIKIFILEQDIFTTYVLESKFRNLSKTVEENVITLFNEDEDCLVHYEEAERGKYIVYSLKGGRRVEALCKKSNAIKVIPIQFKLLNNIRNRIKEKEYSFLYYLDKGIYYTRIKGNKIIKSYFKNSIEDILSSIEGELPLYFYEDERINEEVLKDYRAYKLRKKRSDIRFEKILFE